MIYIIIASLIGILFFVIIIKLVLAIFSIKENLSFLTSIECRRAFNEGLITQDYYNCILNYNNSDK